VNTDTVFFMTEVLLPNYFCIITLELIKKKERHWFQNQVNGEGGRRKKASSF